MKFINYYFQRFMALQKILIKIKDKFVKYQEVYTIKGVKVAIKIIDNPKNRAKGKAV
jgi:hypothetical protein